MASLYELTDEYRQLMTMLEEGEVDEETLKNTMGAIEGDIEEKAEQYAKVMRSLESDVEGLKSEIERLSGHKSVRENNIKRMKAALQGMMEATGKTKFKTPLFSFGIQNNPPSCVIWDDAAVPEQFRIPQPDKIDKKGIIDFLKSLGEDDSCAWAALTQGQSLRIR